MILCSIIYIIHLVYQILCCKLNYIILSQFYRTFEVLQHFIFSKNSNFKTTVIHQFVRILQLFRSLFMSSFISKKTFKIRILYNYLHKLLFLYILYTSGMLYFKIKQYISMISVLQICLQKNYEIFKKLPIIYYINYILNI